mmetsp:Transcript_47165/g.87644  ORF Transcript_47165/g.87644 Transcript_47165/m.87644 type:complete len:95 (+) Transcript_47165:678-962(+)
MEAYDASRPQAKAMPFQKAVTPSFFKRVLTVTPRPLPVTCIRVFTVSMGWVKLTVKTHDAPPSAMDSSRFGALGEFAIFDRIKVKLQVLQNQKL